MYSAVFALQIQQATTSLVFIITQLNAPHLTVAYLPYGKYKDIFIPYTLFIDKHKMSKKEKIYVYKQNE